MVEVLCLDYVTQRAVNTKFRQILKKGGHRIKNFSIYLLGISAALITKVVSVGYSEVHSHTILCW